MDQDQQSKQQIGKKQTVSGSDPISRPTSGSTIVGGDNYDVAVTDSQAVAVGPGARAEINNYHKYIVHHDSIENLPPALGEPPYKGLAYFTEKDANIYFGRESLSKHIASQLHQRHFLALIGASGSGKSSLLRAGVIPQLRSQNWQIHLITPGNHPLDALANSIGRDVASLQFAPKLKQTMLQNSQALYLIGSKFVSRAKAPRLLIAIDQFEELFTQCHDEYERRAFIENLLTAVNKQGAITIIIGLRADFYDRCAQYAGLRELVSQQQEFIGPIQQEELVRVIFEPAKRGGWRLVDGLVEQILEDAGNEPGRLPLLSHALRETWERRRGIVMTLAGYRAAGGVEGAIAKTAEETFSRFDTQQASVAQAVFLSLTELGEGAEDTRRIASLNELEEANPNKPLDNVLQTLVSARLVTTGDGQVEVAHEALIRRWPRLHNWIADNRERLRFERQLLQDAQEWEDLNKDTGSLYRGARLQQAIEWSNQNQILLTGLAASFLSASRDEADREASEKEAQRQRELTQQRKLASEQQKRALEAEAAATKLRGRRNLAFGLASIAIVLAFLGFILFRQAQSASDEAEQQTYLTLSSKLITQAQNTEDPDLRMLLAIEAIRALTDNAQNPNPDAVAELQEALSTGLDKSLITAAGENSLDNNRGAQFSPDGKFLALQRGTYSGSAKLVDVQAPAVVQLPESVAGLDYFEFSPTGRFLAASGERSVYIFEMANLQVQCDSLPQYGFETGIAFNNDEMLLFTYSNEGLGQLWNVQTCEKISDIPNNMPEDQIIGGVFIDSNHLFVVSQNEKRQETGTYWNLTSPKSPIKENEFPFDRIMISNNGKHLARAQDNLIEVIDITNGQVVFSHEFEDFNFLTVRISPDGKYLLASPFRRNMMELWNIETQEKIQEFTALSFGGSHVGKSFVDNGQQTLIAIWNRHQIELRDAETGDLLHSPPSFENDEIDQLTIDPLNQELLIALDNGTVWQWNIDGNYEVTRYLQRIGSLWLYGL